MRLAIAGLAELRARLQAVRPEEVMGRALAEQSERLAEAVREALSGRPGSGEHDRPWLESGALRESVGSVAAGLEAVVGSSDPAAAPQEMGTVKMVPRPFLAPVAAEMGEAVARAVGAAMAAALKDGSSTQSEASAAPVHVDATPDAAAGSLPDTRSAIGQRRAEVGGAGPL